MLIKRKFTHLLVAVLLAATLLTGCGDSGGGGKITGPSPTSHIDLTATQTHDFLNSTENVFVIDVAPFAEFWPAHLYGAYNYSIQNGEFDRIMAGLDINDIYLIYSRDSVSSLTAVEAMTSAGFTDVYRLAENFSVWINAGFPVSVPLPP